MDFHRWRNLLAVVVFAYLQNVIQVTSETFPITLEAQFTVRGVKATLTFTQNSQDSTPEVTWNRRDVTYDWQLRTFGLTLDVADRCSEDLLGPSVSGKNSPSFELTGKNSIEGRSVVALLPDGSSVASCATVQKPGSYVTARATFKQGILGTIVLRQHNDSSLTPATTRVSYDLDFDSLETEGDELEWRIVDSWSDCSSMLHPVFDPEGAGDLNRTCSQDSPEMCAIGDLTGKLGNIKANLSDSPTRSTTVDLHLPLLGENSVVGKTIQIYSPEAHVPHACAAITAFTPRTGVAVFNQDGVKGTVTLTQPSPFDPTLGLINLGNLRSLAGGYHVHSLPVPQRRSVDQQLCGADSTGGHWNPFGVVYDDGAVHYTHDQFEVGDLSGKFGSLQNKTSFSGTFLDFNLPLFGVHSVLGRSLVIHHPDGSRWICSNLRDTSSTLTFALATFRFPVIGHALFSQRKGEEGETSVYVVLDRADGKVLASQNHGWAVHDNPPSDDFLELSGAQGAARCASAGGIYNPYSITTNDACQRDDPRLCKLGDLTKRLGSLDIRQEAGGPSRAFFIDATLDIQGPESVVGRSLVVFESAVEAVAGDDKNNDTADAAAANDSAVTAATTDAAATDAGENGENSIESTPRLACAEIQPLSPRHATVSLLDGDFTVEFSQSAGIIQEPTTISFAYDSTSTTADSLQYAVLSALPVSTHEKEEEDSGYNTIDECQTLFEAVFDPFGTLKINTNAMNTSTNSTTTINTTTNTTTINNTTTNPTTTADQPSFARSTLDQFPVGAISAKLSETSKPLDDEGNPFYLDFTLDLFGPNSVVGRGLSLYLPNGEEVNPNLTNREEGKGLSLNQSNSEGDSLNLSNSGEGSKGFFPQLPKGGGEFQCANITDVVTEGGNQLLAVAVFSGDVVGRILLSQYEYPDGTTSDTSVFVDVRRKDGQKTGGHGWHVHVDPVQCTTDCDSLDPATLCASTGSHYNPFQVNVQENYEECSPINQLRCELGDQARKLGTIEMGTAAMGTDINLPLLGQFGVIGRSFVIHDSDGGSRRIACADIHRITHAVFFYDIYVSTSRKVLKKQRHAVTAALARAVGTKEDNVNVVIHGSVHRSACESCTHLRVFFLGLAAERYHRVFKSLMHTQPDHVGGYKLCSLGFMERGIDLCRLQGQGRLRQFNRDSFTVALPCNYLLTEMTCGDFRVTAWGRSALDQYGFFSPEYLKVKVMKPDEDDVTIMKTAWVGEVYLNDLIHLLALPIKDHPRVPQYLPWRTLEGADYNFGMAWLDPLRDSALVSDLHNTFKLELRVSQDSEDVDGISIGCKDLRDANEFPQSLCGAPGTRKKFSKPWQRQAASARKQRELLLNILQNVDHEQTEQCQEFADTFKNCENEVLAIRSCGPMLSAYRFLLRARDEFATLFHNCLRVFCTSDGELCSRLNTLILSEGLDRYLKLPNAVKGSQFDCNMK